MLLHDQISQSLAELQGPRASEPRTAAWAAEAATISADFTAVDTLSCAIRELRISAPALQHASLDACRAWADAVCARVTYLLERLGPYEIDAPAQTLLLRSTPPGQEPSRLAFYEMQIKAPAAATLRRFAHPVGSGRRQQIDMLLTHDVLQRLVRDIVEAIPVTGEGANRPMNDEIRMSNQLRMTKSE
ncbi:MAG: hypothetical protein ACT4QC_12875 [Planctomycetaceae bacterium]